MRRQPRQAAVDESTEYRVLSTEFRALTFLDEVERHHRRRRRQRRRREFADPMPLRRALFQQRSEGGLIGGLKAVGGDHENGWVSSLTLSGSEGIAESLAETEDNRQGRCYPLACAQGESSSSD